MMYSELPYETTFFCRVEKRLKYNSHCIKSTIKNKTFYSCGLTYDQAKMTLDSYNAGFKEFKHEIVKVRE